MVKKGQKAPPFSLDSMDGKTRGLDQMLESGAAVISFFKISCPVCQLAFPFLERLHQSAGDSGLHFYGISQDGSAATNGFLKDCGVTFPTLLDPSEGGYEVSNAFGIRNVPISFVVEPDGVVSEVIDGFDKAALEALGERVGASPFRDGEDVPIFRPG